PGANTNVARDTFETIQQDLPQVFRIAVGGEADNFALMPHRLETQTAGDLLIEMTQRVGEIEAMQELDAVGATGVDAAARAGAIAIESDQECPVEPRRVKAVGGVGVVVMEAAQFLAEAIFAEPGKQFSRVSPVFGRGSAQPLTKKSPMDLPIEPGRSGG